MSMWSTVFPLHSIARNSYPVCTRHGGEHICTIHVASDLFLWFVAHISFSAYLLVSLRRYLRIRALTLPCRKGLDSSHALRTKNRFSLALVFIILPSLSSKTDTPTHISHRGISRFLDPSLFTAVFPVLARFYLLFLAFRLLTKNCFILFFGTQAAKTTHLSLFSFLSYRYPRTIIVEMRSIHQSWTPYSVLSLFSLLSQGATPILHLQSASPPAIPIPYCTK